MTNETEDFTNNENVEERVPLEVEETAPPAEETDPSTGETEPPAEEVVPPTEETDPPTEETDPPAEETDPSTEETEPPTEETPPPPPPPPSFLRLYTNTQTGEIRELDDVLIFEWKQAGNPKGDVWEIYEPPTPPEPAPVADWEAFESQALSSSSLKEIFPKIVEVNPVAMSLLGPALLKAKGGSSDDFARIWLRIVVDMSATETPLPPDLLETFVNVAKAYNLPEEFVNALRGVVEEVDELDEEADPPTEEAEPSTEEADPPAEEAEPSTEEAEPSTEEADPPAEETE